MNYCPLNITTCYTFLSSSLKIDDIFKIAIKLGYLSFGVNDLLVMHSYGNIASLEKKYHLNPAYGVKLNVSYNEYTFPLSCYIHNEEGYRNLIALISLRKETIDNDARLRRIVLTNKALDIRKELEKSIKKVEKQAIQGLTKEEAENYIKLTKKMSENLEKKERIGK